MPYVNFFKKIIKYLFDIIKFVKERRIRVETFDALLHQAIVYKEWSVVREIIEELQKTNQELADGNTPLHFLARMNYGDEEYFQLMDELLKKHPDWLKKRNLSGHSPYGGGNISKG